MKLKDETPVEIVAILDRSGSMHTIHSDSIGGFNAFLEEQKKIDSPAKISVVLFDNLYDVIYDDVDIQEAKPLTKATYQLGGTTAMNDAIGKTLNKLFQKNPERAVICILTDGQENASKEFTTAQTKQLIEKAQGKGWRVVFLAANQDAFATATSYGINTAYTANFAADSKGTRAAYSGLLSTATSSYRNEDKK
jgi:uncharacterized protein with von Willebrand factor type A (vWA) domain